jgi:hypothetical protein
MIDVCSPQGVRDIIETDDDDDDDDSVTTPTNQVLLQLAPSLEELLQDSFWLRP